MTTRTTSNRHKAIVLPTGASHKRHRLVVTPQRSRAASFHSSFARRKMALPKVTHMIVTQNRRPRRIHLVTKHSFLDCIVHLGRGQGFCDDSVDYNLSTKKHGKGVVNSTIFKNVFSFEAHKTDLN